MYKNIYVEDRYEDVVKVHLWDDERGYVKMDFENYLYIRTEGETEMEAYDGSAVMKMLRRDYQKSMKYELKSAYGENADVTYESDLPIETKILIDLYGGDTEISTGHREYFFDIEVSIEGGYPDPETAQNPITSIAAWDKSSGNSVVLILDEDDVIDRVKTEDVLVIPFKNERKLLKAFLAHWKKVDPTIITGWNSSGFDVPYLYNRLVRVMGKAGGNMLSPIGKVHKSRGGKYTIAGVNHLDYLDLYRKFSYTELSSYSLDNVSNVELDRGKVEYEGIEVEYEGEMKTIRNLDDLKKYDVQRFIDYNLEDVYLVRDIDRKFKYMELARTICHLGYVPYDNIEMSSRYIEGAMIADLRKHDKVAPDKKSRVSYTPIQHHITGQNEIEVKEGIHNDISRSGTIGIQKTATTKKRVEYVDYTGSAFILKEPLEFDVETGMDITHEYEGAYVKTPKPGMYDWVYDLDLTSMYPSIIISLNISPETKIGRVYNYTDPNGDKSWDVKEYMANEDGNYRVWLYSDQDFIEFSQKELHAWLTRNKYCVAANGVIYNTEEQGLIPRLLAKWFDLRQSYKKKRNVESEKGNEEMEEYYDKLQLVYKILINSVYGVLGLPVFRFYDLDNAEAVTLTGQQLIKLTSEMGDHYYSDYTGKDQEWCIYTDTDSTTGDAEMTVRFGDGEQEKLPIMEVYKRLQKSDDTQIIKQKSREFLFPKNVASIAYKNGTVIEGQIDYIERHLVSKQLYQITTQSGHSVRVTGDHSVMVSMPRGLMKVATKDLWPGDSVIVLKNGKPVEVAVEKVEADETQTEQYLYDVGMVDSPRVFFANDILVHNSVFYGAVPIVKADNPDADVNDDGYMTAKIRDVAKKVQQYLNDVYDRYAEAMLYIPKDRIEHYFEIKQELIAKSALWTGKKRYAQWIIDDEGRPVDKLDVKGLDIVRSDFPPAFKGLLKKIIVGFLKGETKETVDKWILDFEDNLDNKDLISIARPTGVKHVTKWETGEFGDRKSGCSAHIKAALSYNDLIRYREAENAYPLIKDGEKIKWVYLKTNPLNLESMAFKGVDDPDFVMEFIEEYVDRQEMYERELKTKIKMVYDALGYEMPSKQLQKAQKFFTI